MRGKHKKTNYISEYITIYEDGGLDSTSIIVIATIK